MEVFTLEYGQPSSHRLPRMSSLSSYMCRALDLVLAEREINLATIFTMTAEILGVHPQVELILCVQLSASWDVLLQVTGSMLMKTVTV